MSPQNWPYILLLQINHSCKLSWSNGITLAKTVSTRAISQRRPKGKLLEIISTWFSLVIFLLWFLLSHIFHFRHGKCGKEFFFKSWHEKWTRLILNLILLYRVCGLCRTYEFITWCWSFQKKIVKYQIKISIVRAGIRPKFNAGQFWSDMDFELTNVL